MPYVNIKVTREHGGVTVAQKKELIVRTAQMLKDVLNKDPGATFVVIDEVDTDAWGVGYESVTELRTRQAKDK